MSTNLFEYQASVTWDASEFEKGMKNAESNFGKFKTSLANAGKAIGVGVTAALGTVTTGVAALVTATSKGISDLASYGDNIDKMSQKLGISAEAYQEWDFICQHCGTSVDSLQSSIKTLSNAAQDGNEAFEKLGISLEDAASMSTEDLFSAVITGLQNMEEGTERTALASDLLGKGATELGALLNASAEDTEAMRQQVHELGGVMSDEAVANAATYQDSLQNLQTSIQGLTRDALAEFLPAVTSVMDGLTKIFSGDSSGIGLINQGVSDFVNSLSTAIPQILEMGTNIVLTLASAIVQNVPQIMKAGTNIIMELVNGIITMLPSIAEAALQIISTAATGIAENTPTLITTVIDVLLQIVQTLIDNLPVLLEAVLQIIQGLAQGILDSIPIILEALPQVITSIIDFVLSAIPQIIECGIQLLTSLVSALPTIIEAIVAAIPEIINGIITAVINAIPQIIQAGIELLISLVQALPTIILTIVDAIPKIISSIIDALMNNLDKIIMAGVQVFVALIQNLPTIIVEIVKAVPQIITGIVNAFGSLTSKMAEVGGNIVKGLWNGIQQLASWLWNKVSGWISSIWDGICNFFGIHSPSREMAWVGENLVKGLAGGIDDNGDTAVESAEKMSADVLNTYEHMADDIAEIEKDALNNSAIKKSVTLSTSYDNSAVSPVVVSTSAVTGFENVFDSFLTRFNGILDRWLDGISISGGSGVSATNAITVKMGDWHISGLFDKGAENKIENIAEKHVQAFSDELAETYRNA